jgi:hypothetical protein
MCQPEKAGQTTGSTSSWSKNKVLSGRNLAAFSKMKKVESEGHHRLKTTPRGVKEQWHRMKGRAVWKIKKFAVSRRSGTGHAYNGVGISNIEQQN